jgi:hypothetical protein
MRYILIISILLLVACSSKPSSSNPVQRQQFVDVSANTTGAGPTFVLKFYGGPSLYYPLMAVWLEDEQGRYIQTLFVPKSIATGVFRYGSNATGKWTEAAKRAPQTLPYWSHQRGVIARDGLYMPDPDHPVPDAYSGATPTTSFTLTTRADEPLPRKFSVMFEVNQNWDWNEYWTNNKYPGDVYYLNSAQPAVVYQSTVDQDNMQDHYVMKAVGHSHPSGMSGELFPDISTLTTALHIADSIIIRIKE